VDPIEQARLEKERIQKADAAAAAAKADTSGSTKDSSLRNRKAAGKEEASTWTVTNHEDADNLVDEETKLRAVDPLDLFGFPTRELRQAQQDARRAVEVYMEAANLLLALQAELKSA
jgi:Mg-chelatase subunit ChlD